MGKAKMFGGVAVVVGLVLLLLAMLVVGGTNVSVFASFLWSIFVPILLVTVALVAIIIGVLLLVYG